ncbi:MULTISPECIES: hypothetical protein [Lactobacillus]|uniref:Uncharacterized protein n=1 Tax=Lactobacillus xujianguonis TaxID=2495899 RepID=A0A437SVF1_9LACO|nr:MULTISPECIES: hypothetical protein [Lactobacillus]RVU70905.1 hypothetical protein EJK17_04940 [Lactobacillus xujianguonis]RVU73749.1 hypothetical protein EJK20_06485 [Lactobacillus xujianguonis]
MKKRLGAILLAMIACSCFMIATPQSTQASSKYGKIGTVITPTNMRGKWRYQGSSILGQKTYRHYKVRIGKHHVNGLRLFQADTAITSKYAANYKKYHFIIDQTMNWGNATIFNRNGIQWLNVNGWTAGAGNGTFYGLTTHEHHGKMEPALAIAIGYKPTIVAYAYRVSKYHPIKPYREFNRTDLENQY